MKRDERRTGSPLLAGCWGRADHGADGRKRMSLSDVVLAALTCVL